GSGGPSGGSGSGGPSGGSGSGGPWVGGSGSGGPPPGVFPPGGGSDEPCPDPPVVQNFNLTGYLGRWYEVERMFNPFQYGDCVIADYTLKEDGTVQVIISNVL
ncbi:unnamed protein product, partial [Meganyctiphanes norvegica]